MNNRPQHGLVRTRMRAGGTSRRSSGNVLALTMAVMLFIILPVALFSEQYVRMTGAHQQQRTAIEAAALAAARDMTRIVVEDEYYGFVGLSDYAPTGKGTTAGDGYCLPVRSINTILATVRLDMIVADLLNSSVMKRLALRDYANAMKAKDLLIATLTNATGGGTATDIDGKLVTPVQDAVSAYNSNCIQMAGTSNLVANSMKLTLGYESEMYTNTVIPEPVSIANCTSSQQSGNLYRADTDVPYDGNSFVFAAVANDVDLVDFRTFQTSVSGVPYSIPAMVKAEADQLFLVRQTNGPLKQGSVHAAACARAASLGDKVPAPGAFMIDFTVGHIPGINSLSDFLSSNQIMKSPVDLLNTARGGDSPSMGLQETNADFFTDNHPPFGDVMALVIYDWIRRGGTQVNVADVVSMFTAPFPSGSGAYSFMYYWDGNGNIKSTTASTLVSGTFAVSENQIYARSGVPYIGGSGPFSLYDVWVKDYCFQPGRKLGGDHAGEPLLTMSQGNTSTVKKPPVGIGRVIDEPANWDSLLFPIANPVGQPRPTFTKTGLALVFQFNLRQPPEVLPGL